MLDRLCRTGFVVERHAASVRIAFSTSGACVACEAGLGCGIGPIMGLLQSPGSGSLSFDDVGVKDLRIGDSVSIGIGSRELLLQICLVYLLPLAGLLAGAVWMSLGMSRTGDLWTAIGAGAGFAVAYALARMLRMMWNLDEGLKPRIVPSSR